MFTSNSNSYCFSHSRPSPSYYYNHHNYQRDYYSYVNDSSNFPNNLYLMSDTFYYPNTIYPKFNTNSGYVSRDRTRKARAAENNEESLNETTLIEEVKSESTEIKTKKKLRFTGIPQPGINNLKEEKNESSPGREIKIEIEKNSKSMENDEALQNKSTEKKFDAEIKNFLNRDEKVLWKDKLYKVIKEADGQILLQEVA